MPSVKPSERSLQKMLDIQWQDHFQTRTQTWKALEITALIAIALVGLDWRVSSPIVTVGVAILLFVIAQFGIQITLKHRQVERTKFLIIAGLEKELGLDRLENQYAKVGVHLTTPQPLSWWSIFQIRKSNNPLFIMRMHFAIQLFALGYLVLRLSGR